MKAIEFTTTVTDRRLPKAVSQALVDAIARLDGKQVRIVLQALVNRRSIKQSRFYFGVIVPLVVDMFREAGNDLDEKEAHLYLKEHVGGLKRKLRTPAGEWQTILRSTASLTTSEFEDYLQKIRVWAAEFGTIVPLPNEPFNHLENP